jgi:V/A-type H+-transporting ATPase subunit F
MSLGFGVFEAENAKQAGEYIDKLAWDNYAVIFVTQTYAKELSELIAKYADKPLPAIVPIPDKNGSDYGDSILKDAVIRAVGADILKD